MMNETVTKRQVANMLMKYFPAEEVDADTSERILKFSMEIFDD